MFTFLFDYNDLKINAVTSKCSRMYGGLVMPIRSMHPSGICSTIFHNSSTILVPMSRPYAPVSSLVSQISTTPSKSSQIRKLRQNV